MIIAIIILSIALVVAVSAVITIQNNSTKGYLALSDKHETEKNELQAKLADMTAAKAALESSLNAKEELLKSLSENREKDLKQMKESFEFLSAKNSDVFREKSAASIAELLKPVQEKFKEFSDSVKETQKENADRHSKLEQKIIDLNEQSKSVGDEARNLANALTGYSKVQGDFGEMVLAEILKNAGLTEGIHFITQGVITDENGHEVKSDSGKTLIPDVLVNYPDDTAVVIDSKVSLKAYNDFMNAVSVEDRVKTAKAHIESVKKHVEELVNKDYASYIPEGKRKVNFNIMFIPIEGAFRLMLDEDPILWQAAKDKNVLIVSQMTLVIVLNMIQMSWKQNEQEKNIEDVYRTAEELMSQIRGWLESYVKVGDALNKANSLYQDSQKKLVDSNQSVVKKIAKLEKLGLAPKRSSGKINTGTRKLVGGESVIPKELSSSNPDEDAGQEEVQ